MKRYTLILEMTDDATDIDVALALRAAATDAADQFEGGICPLPEVDQEILFQADNDKCLQASMFRSE